MQGPGPRLRILMAAWGRFVLAACASAMFILVLYVLSAVDGWLYYIEPWDVAAGITERIFLAILLGAAIGTVCFAAALPFLLSNREALAARSRIAVFVTVVAAGVVCFSFLLRALLVWAATLGLGSVTHGYKIGLGIAILIAFAAVIYRPTTRKKLQNYLDDTFGSKLTRRVVLASVAGSALVWAPKSAVHLASGPSPRGAVDPGIKRANMLLVTFDALAAEDMSLYGYHLPTTPNIDAFASSAAVFDNFYSCSTFTTCSIAAMLSGRYPENNLVYQLDGGFLPSQARKTAMRALRDAGYMTAASVANPHAHPDILEIDRQFDLLPSPALRQYEIPGALMTIGCGNVALDTQQALGYPNAILVATAPKLFAATDSPFPPRLSVEQGFSLLERLEPPYFLWIHFFAPHQDYQPRPPYLHRFLPDDTMRTGPELAVLFNCPDGQIHAGPAADDRQGAPALRRMDLRSGRGVRAAALVGGKIRQADEHGGDRFLRSRREFSRRRLQSWQFDPSPSDDPCSARCATARSDAAKTYFDNDRSNGACSNLGRSGEFARPSWMDGNSLLPLVRGDVGARSLNLAFTQYLAGNSVFAPLRHGTVGVIDGQHQYVLDISTGKGKLRRLAEAHLPSIDRSSEEPELALALRRIILKRFPTIRGVTA